MVVWSLSANAGGTCLRHPAPLGEIAQSACSWSQTWLQKIPVMSGQTSLLVTLLIGGITGWCAGLIARGSGYGLIGDIIAGLLGALLGSYLFTL